MATVTIIIADDEEDNAQDGLDSVTITVRSDSPVPEMRDEATPAMQYAEVLLQAAADQSQVFEQYDDPYTIPESPESTDDDDHEGFE